MQLNAVLHWDHPKHDAKYSDNVLQILALAHDMFGQPSQGGPSMMSSSYQFGGMWTPRANFMACNPFGLSSLLCLHGGPEFLILFDDRLKRFLIINTLQWQNPCAPPYKQIQAKFWTKQAMGLWGVFPTAVDDDCRLPKQHNYHTTASTRHKSCTYFPQGSATSKPRSEAKLTNTYFFHKGQHKCSSGLSAAAQAPKDFRVQALVLKVGARIFGIKNLGLKVYFSRLRLKDFGFKGGRVKDFGLKDFRVQGFRVL